MMTKRPEFIRNKLLIEVFYLQCDAGVLIPEIYWNEIKDTAEIAELINMSIFIPRYLICKFIYNLYVHHLLGSWTTMAMKLNFYCDGSLGSKVITIKLCIIVTEAINSLFHIHHSCAAKTERFGSSELWKCNHWNWQASTSPWLDIAVKHFTCEINFFGKEQCERVEH